MIANPTRLLARLGRLSSLLLPLPVMLAASCAGTPEHPDVVVETEAADRARREVEAVLDDFHDAASKADGERYFGHQAAGSVFLGTDATERWEKAEFEAYAAPFFGAGRGWTYRPLERHVYLDPDGNTAWFDERLINEKYGETRGTGVLVRVGGAWRMAQYNLTIPVPNDLALDLVERIRAFEAGKGE